MNPAGINPARNPAWPALPYDAWQATCRTLHLWTQVVGKIRLGLTPWLNHSWHVPLYVTARGLTTTPVPYGALAFEITFDFNAHVLDIEASNGTHRQLKLQPQSVAAFLTAVLNALAELGIIVSIRDQPCEIPDALPLSQDHQHKDYDARYAHRFWQALVQVDRVFKHFRTGFVGKSSPVHFFWGSFDLAVTRFSGKEAPTFERPVPGVALEVMRDAYSHEVSSAGFWPGGGGIDYPCFYSYAYPQPPGFAETAVAPADAFFGKALGEFLLPYDVVRESADPDATLLAFLQSTYEAAARCGNWDRASLECALGAAGVPRKSS